MPTYLAYSTATYQRDNQPKQQQHQRERERERERARESESESESERESGSERATSNSEQAQAVKGGGVGGSSTQLNTFTLCPRPPVCAPPLSGAWAQTVTVTSNDTSVSVCGGGTGMSACAQTNNRDMGGRGYFRRDWMAYLFVAPRRAST